MLLQNNPRAVARCMSLAAWRSDYDQQTGIASLHVDISFKTGKIGDDLRHEVRFEFQLRRAELRILRDPEGIVEIITPSVLTPEDAQTSANVKVITKSQQDIERSGELSTSKQKAAGAKNNKESTEVSVEFQHTEKNSTIEFDTHHDNEYVSFEFTSSTEFLTDRPWNKREAVSEIRNRKYRHWKSSPELKIVVVCRLEDIHIPPETVEFKDGGFLSNLTANRRMVALQALKTEILSMGLECGDIKEKLAEAILADVIAEHY